MIHFKHVFKRPEKENPLVFFVLTQSSFNLFKLGLR